MNEIELKKVEKIRMQYQAKEVTDVEELKMLHKKIKKPARVFAYVFGIIGALVLGVGMCLAMEVIGDLMILGIAIGVVGIAIVSFNYPIYKKMQENRMKRHSKKIIELSNSIMNK